MDAAPAHVAACWEALPPTCARRVPQKRWASRRTALTAAAPQKCSSRKCTGCGWPDCPVSAAPGRTSAGCQKRGCQKGCQERRGACTWKRARGGWTSWFEPGLNLGAPSCLQLRHTRRHPAALVHVCTRRSSHQQASLGGAAPHHVHRGEEVIVVAHEVHLANRRQRLLLGQTVGPDAQA